VFSQLEYFVRHSGEGEAGRQRNVGNRRRHAGVPASVSAEHPAPERDRRRQSTMTQNDERIRRLI